MPANVPPWNNLTFENSWSNYSASMGGDWETLQYRIWDRSGICEVRGLVRKVSGTASVSEVIANLPAAASPLNSFNTAAAGGLGVEAGGLVQFSSISNEGGSVAKIKYLAGNPLHLGIRTTYAVATT